MSSTTRPRFSLSAARRKIQNLRMDLDNARATLVCGHPASLSFKPPGSSHSCCELCWTKAQLEQAAPRRQTPADELLLSSTIGATATIVTTAVNGKTTEAGADFTLYLTAQGAQIARILTLLDDAGVDVEFVDAKGGAQ